MYFARAGSAVCEVNGIAYAIGGWGNGQYLSSIEAYEPTTNTWTRKADMSTPRGYLTASVVNGIIYVIGGYRSGPVGEVEAYNPSTNTWTKKADMPTPRYGLTSAVVNGLIYVIGGAIGSSGTEPVDVLEIYDPSTDKWTKKTMPFTFAWGSGSACVIDNLIYLVEGSISYNMVYDPATDVWKRLTDKYTITDGNTCNVINKKIYVIGGWVNHGNETSGSVYEYDFSKAPKHTKTENKLTTLWGSVKIND